MRRLLLSVLTITVFSSTGLADTSADNSATPPLPLNVFDEPRRQAEYNKLKQSITLLLNGKKWSEAKQSLSELQEFTPWDPALHYQIARLSAIGGDNGAALASLEQAIDSGMTNIRILEQDPAFAAVRLNARYPALLEKAERLKKADIAIVPTSVNPSRVTEGNATISVDNTFYDFRIGLFRSLLEQPTIESFPAATKPKERDATTKWLNGKIDSGEAGGYLGYFYDNRDAGHSRLNVSPYPLLARIEYGPEAIRRNHHNGPQLRFLYNRATIGNSSTAVTGGAYWRSQPRFAYTNPKFIAVLAAQYSSNQLYIYPEHLDHDAEYGDLFPANTPYVLISQGSSGSDQVFLQTLFEALGALKPGVKERLLQSKALIPTLQQLFRYSNKNVQDAEIYLSGKAHPTVFDGVNLDRDYLVRSANDLTVDQLPPLIRLNVVAESPALSGPDFYSPRSEILFNTPQSIARVFRGMKYSRTIVVSAANSVDLNGAPLTYQWRLLRGDPDLVTITPNGDGSVAEITVSYHRERPISPDNPLLSSRVDIGAFASNGTHYSAPAFITYHFLNHEKRSYNESNQILSVDYRSGESPLYIDPMIDGIRNWVDEFHYAEDAPDRLEGWTRTLPDGSTQQFTPQGVLIAEGSLSGGIKSVKGVRYVEQQTSAETPPTVQMKTTDNSITYEEFLERLKKVNAPPNGSNPGEPMPAPTP